MTLAQTVRQRFNTATKTVSVVELARREQAVRYDKRDESTGLITSRYIFPDGSALEVSGRGNNHKITVV
jgi:hypothetical protein